MILRLGEGHMPSNFFLSEQQLKTTVVSGFQTLGGQKFEFSLMFLYYLQPFILQYLESGITEIVCAHLTFGDAWCRNWNELLPKHGWAIAHPAHRPLTPLRKHKGSIYFLQLH